MATMTVHGQTDRKLALYSNINFLRAIGWKFPLQSAVIITTVTVTDAFTQISKTHCNNQSCTEQCIRQ